MRTLAEWTLMVMFGILHYIAGQLHEPLNITTISRNFSLFMTWLPAPENPPNVTYTVNYMLVYKKRWHKVPECMGTFATECDLTCILLKKASNLHSIRVKAVSVSQWESSWVYLPNITYMFTVDPPPPILKIIKGDGTMMINISIPEPHCEKINFNYLWHLKYNLDITSINNPMKIIQKELNELSTTIKTDGYEGSYCMVARTIYQPDSNSKNSLPSKSICLTFSQKDQNRHLMPLFGLPVMLSIMFVGALIFIIWFKTNQYAAIPTALDFSHTKCALANLPTSNESAYFLTINKNMDQTSSATFLLSVEDTADIKKYPLSGQGYTERKTMYDNCLEEDTYYIHSSGDEQMFSEDSPTNFSIDESSDSSCIQTSGSNAEMTLMLKKIQLLNQSEETNANISGNVDTSITNNTTIGPLLETLCVSSSNGFGDVHLSTLYTGPYDQCSDNASYDCHFTDSEESHEKSPNDCTDCNESCMEPQPSQNNWSSDYEQRGYMSRR